MPGSRPGSGVGSTRLNLNPEWPFWIRTPRPVELAPTDVTVVVGAALATGAAVAPTVLATVPVTSSTAAGSLGDGGTRLELAADQTVTLASGENLPHGSVFLNGDLYLSLRTSPGKVIRHTTPDTDLSTYTVFTGSGVNSAENSFDSIVYVASTSKLYVCGAGFQPASDFLVRIKEVDPSAMTATTLVEANVGTVNPSISVLGTDDVDLFLMTLTNDSTNGCTYVPIDLPSGTAGTPLLMGANRGRGHTMVWDSTNSRMRVGGTNGIGGSSQPWVGWVNQAGDTKDTVAVGNAGETITDDSVWVGGTHHWVGIETAGSGKVIRVTNDLGTVTTLTDARLTGGVFALHYDGTWVWATVRGTPGSVVQIDPSSFTVVSSFPMQSGENDTNEVIRDGNNIYVTHFLSPGKVSRYDLTEVARSGATPVVTVPTSSAVAAGVTPAPTPTVVVPVTAALALGVTPAPSVIVGGNVIVSVSAAVALGSTPAPTVLVTVPVTAALALGVTAAPTVAAAVSAAAGLAAGSAPAPAVLATVSPAAALAAGSTAAPVVLARVFPAAAVALGSAAATAAITKAVTATLAAGVTPSPAVLVVVLTTPAVALGVTPAPAVVIAGNVTVVVQPAVAVGTAPAPVVLVTRPVTAATALGVTPAPALRVVVPTLYALAVGTAPNANAIAGIFYVAATVTLADDNTVAVAAENAAGADVDTDDLTGPHVQILELVP